MRKMGWQITEAFCSHSWLSTNFRQMIPEATASPETLFPYLTIKRLHYRLSMGKGNSHSRHSVFLPRVHAKIGNLMRSGDSPNMCTIYTRTHLLCLWVKQDWILCINFIQLVPHHLVHLAIPIIKESEVLLNSSTSFVGNVLQANMDSGHYRN